MKKQVKCISVRLQDLYEISDKAVVAVDFNGNEDIFPKSQVFGRDEQVEKSDAWWIAEWILKQKKITYSGKKSCYFDENRVKKTKGEYVHTPKEKQPKKSNEIDDLRK